MIIDPSLTSYIHSLDTDNPEILENIRCSAADKNVPIIRREMESFLRVVLEMKKPARILEIGTAIAYSAIFFALNTDDNCTITTIENYAPRLIAARENIEGARLTDRIKLVEGDAGEVLQTMDGTYDLVFLDAAKGQYIVMLPDILRLMRPGSVLIADNVLQDGEIAYSRYIMPRRQRTIHERMREFIYAVKHSSVLDTSVLTIGDGVTFSVMKESSETNQTSERI